MTLLCVAFILVVLVCGEVLFSLVLPRLSAALKEDPGSLSWRGFVLWVATSWLFGLVGMFGYVTLADRRGTDLWLYVGLLAAGLVVWLVSRQVWPRTTIPRQGRPAITIGFFLAAVSLLLLLLASRSK
jgi:hypothetical protein